MNAGDDHARLDADLLAAHATGDHHALVDLYAAAAAQARDDGDDLRAGFYLTHAWVFALETGHARQDELRKRLAADGRVDGAGDLG